MAKFGSLSGSASDPYRVVLIDPATDEPLKDANGGEAYIDVLSAQSETGRKFDRERAQLITRRAMRSRGRDIDDDQFQANVQKLARLTVAWRLVDPVTKEPLDVPYSLETAAEFYALPKAYPFFLQAWLGAHEPANFIKASSTS